MSLTKARLCSALLALSALAAPAFADPTITFVATPDPAEQGSGVDIQVMISGVTDLYGFNFSVSFDSSLLHITSVTEGSFLSSGGSTFFGGGDIDNTAGTLSYSFNSLLSAVPGVSGSGTLAIIHMDALATGTSPLSFVPAETLFLNSTGGDITVQAVNTTLQVAATVPEPGTYLMLAAGIAGLGLWRRRQAA